MDWQRQHILVTGGTGFIGSFLAQELLQRGAKVRIPLHAHGYGFLLPRKGAIEWMEGDLRDPTFCRTLCKGIDRVFHLASFRRNVALHQEQPALFLAENTLMTVALIEGLRASPTSSVTFVSTANILPDHCLETLARQCCLDGYLLGKMVSELLFAREASSQHFPLLIVRPVGVYGPRDTFAEEGNVVPALMVRAARSGHELLVWGSGKQERSFLYVADLIASLFLLLEGGAEGVQYVSPDVVVSIRELATHIRDLVHPELTLRFDATKAEGRHRTPRVPLHSSLKGFPWTPLLEGLRLTVEAWQSGRSKEPSATLPACA